MTANELLKLAQRAAERAVAKELPEALAKQLGPMPAGWLHEVHTWTAAITAEAYVWRGVKLVGGLINANEEQAAEAIAPWAEWLGVPTRSHDGEIEATREIDGVTVTVYVVANREEFEAGVSR